MTRDVAGSGSRRRLLRGLAAGSLAAALGALRLRGTDAAEVGAASCRERLDQCQERSDCCEAEKGHNIGCARLSTPNCRQRFEGRRCCGRAQSRCSSNCDCCRGYRCDGVACKPQ